MTSCPKFTIVIPVYNRPHEIRRALRSCLVQPFPAFEIVVVDDASTDDTYEAARDCGDDRVTVLQHDRNRGVCAARNTGVRQAKAEWVIFLDSDDELVPGALERIARRAREAPPSVHRLGFSYIHPDGYVSPAPVGDGETLDYVGYMRWADRVQRSDFSNCIRRSTFRVVQLPETRVYERIYHLDFARHFNTLLLRDIVARVHGDASNRASNVSLSRYVRRQKSEALDGLNGLEELLSRHGTALRQFAPRTHRSLLRQRIETAFLSGQFQKGLQCGAEFLRDYPSAASGWATLTAGLLGPGSVAALKFLNARRRAWQ